MKTVKEIIRPVSKVAAGIAAFVFLRAPFSDTGWLLMAGSVIVCIVCMGAYKWSEPDEDPPVERRFKPTAT